MAKTSESVGVLVRAAIWECGSLLLLPFLIVYELTRSVWSFVAKQFRQ